MLSFNPTDGPAELLYGTFINKVRRERGDELASKVQGWALHITSGCGLCLAGLFVAESWIPVQQALHVKWWLQTGVLELQEIGTDHCQLLYHLVYRCPAFESDLLRSDDFAESLSLTKWVPSPTKMTRAWVETNIDRSRKRMDVKTLDMLQFHWCVHFSVLQQTVAVLQHLAVLIDLLRRTLSTELGNPLVAGQTSPTCRPCLIFNLSV